MPAKEKGKDADGKTLYEDVSLTGCIDTLLSPEALEYSCPSCQKNVLAIKYVLPPYDYSADAHDLDYRRSRFATFPQVLVVHAKKFQLVNWVPTKLGEPIAR